MRSLRFYAVACVLFLSTLACSLFGAKSTPSDTLFSDDFSTKEHKWDQVNSSAATTDYYNETYHIVVNDKSSDAWANPGKESFTDVHVEVDAIKNGGPNDNDFGIICRYVDVNQFYYAVISSDGYYSIMKMSGGVGKPIGKQDMLESDKIIQGSATNRIRLDCVGSTLTLYVNDTLIDKQTDVDYTEGNIGLIAGTFDTAGTDIVFDNLVVYKP